MIVQDSMIKEFTILRPADFPYRIISLVGYFYNDHHTMNFHHAAGMDLMYKQEKICYLIGLNEFYQLLKLKNVQESHEPKYNWLLIKGTFGNEPEVQANIRIENEKLLQQKQPHNQIQKTNLFLNRIVEKDDEIIIKDEFETNIFHHFLCNEVMTGIPDELPLIESAYLNSYKNLNHVFNSWLNKENNLTPLS